MKLGNKLIAAFLAGAMILSGSGITASATDTQNESGQPSEDPTAQNTEGQAADPNAGYKIDPVTIESSAMPMTEEDIEKQMAVQLSIKPETNSLENWPQGPDVTADSAIVMDINSGAILYGKQVDKKEYPASITKIMTALLALENGDLNADRVTFSEDCINFLEYGDAHIGMQAGEEISLNDAMYGMLLASANEVSYAIAENIGNKLGIGYTGFIEKMTTRAQELGCENTHFMNANGLHDPNHYVSAKDMAMISAEAYKYEAFRNVIKTQQYTIPPTNLVGEQRTFQQNHKMIYEGNQYYYDACTSGKTGYTDQARTTLVSYAEKNGMQLVCVVLRTRGGVAYTDTQALFEYAFNNFQKVLLKNVETSKDFSKIPEDAYVILPKTASTDELMEKVEKTVSPAEDNKKEAEVTYTYGDVPIGKATLTFSEGYLLKQEKKTEEADGKAEKSKEEKKEEGLPLWAKILIGLGAVILIAGIILYIYVRCEKEKRRRRNLKRKRAKQREMEAEERRRSAERQKHQQNRQRNRQSYPTNYEGRAGRNDIKRRTDLNYRNEQYRSRYDHSHSANQNHYTRNRKG